MNITNNQKETIPFFFKNNRPNTYNFLNNERRIVQAKLFFHKIAKAFEQSRYSNIENFLKNLIK